VVVDNVDNDSSACGPHKNQKRQRHRELEAAIGMHQSRCSPVVIGREVDGLKEVENGGGGQQPREHMSHVVEFMEESEAPRMSSRSTCATRLRYTPISGLGVENKGFQSFGANFVKLKKKNETARFGPFPGRSPGIVPESGGQYSWFGQVSANRSGSRDLVT
jgi:hypothetical protein